MKVQIEKKKRPKWVLPLVCIFGGIILALTIITILVNQFGGKTSIYDDVSNFMAIEKCNFRYNFSVRSEEHNDANKNIDLEDYMTSGDSADAYEGIKDSSSVSSDTATEAPTEKRSQTGSLYSERINTAWGTADGGKAIDWDYPNFEVIITGRTESVEPLKSAVSIRVMTEYTNEVFCNMAFINDKCYIDIKALRNWLLSAGDTSLVSLANNLPDNTVYIELDEAKLRFATSFAELGEEQYSGASSVKNLYDRLSILENILADALKTKMTDVGMTAEDNKCRLSLSGDSANKLIGVLGNILSNSSSYYDLYSSSLEKNGLLENQNEKDQLFNEKDNFLSFMSGKWASFTGLTADERNTLNLNILGRTNSYTASQGSSVAELNFGISFTTNNIDYIITAYGCKQDLSSSSDIKVEVPSETTVSLSSVSNYDLAYVKEYLLYYFRLRESDSSCKLNVSLDTITENALSNFADYVNSANAELSGGLTKQNIYTIKSYISKYANMSEVDANSNEVTKANYDLVQGFIQALETMESISGVKTDQGTTNEGNAKFDVVSKDYFITGDISEVESNSEVMVVKLKYTNLSNKDVMLDLSKWFVKDKSGNKYPCNYETQLSSFNKVIDISKVKTSAEVKALTVADLASVATRNNTLESVKDKSSLDGYLDSARGWSTAVLEKLPSTDITLYIATSNQKDLTLYSETDEIGLLVK